MYTEEDFEKEVKKFEKKHGKNVKYIWNRKKIKESENGSS